MDKLLKHVSTLYDKFESWRMVGQEIAWEAHDRGLIDHVNGESMRFSSLANAVYREVVNDSPKLRQALGLPPKTVEVPPCPDCGEVHEQLHTCTDKLQQRRSRPKRYRMHIECGYGDPGRRRKASVEAALAARGYDSLTDYVLEALGVN